MSRPPDSTRDPPPSNEEADRPPGGTTRSPADADIERIKPIKPGRASDDTSEAGGVD